MIDTIKSVLMNRDKMSEADADELISDMKEQVLNGADPEEVLHDEVGLEPDYLWELFD